MYTDDIRLCVGMVLIRAADGYTGLRMISDMDSYQCVGVIRFNIVGQTDVLVYIFLRDNAIVICYCDLFSISDSFAIIMVQHDTHLARLSI